MKKVVLIDGNNLVFRSYYATAYTGNIMKNSQGFPTNALYGFVNMINKIILEESPEYVVVAFDIGKNFRKEKYDFYKEGRSETPDELKLQMPVAREILDGMGIKYLELAPYEADDIIGSVAKEAEKNDDYYSLIVSSDKDLLQLISFETEIKLLKQTGFVRYNEEEFKKEWGIDPIRIIDLKALMGDSSDNIPGVKGVGEKTALKLLQDYGSLDGIYENVNNIKGKLQEKLIDGKNDAYMSYEIATIYRDVPLNINFEEFKYNGPNVLKLKSIYERLEFYSLLKNIVIPNDIENKNDYIIVNNIEDLKIDDNISLYVEVDNVNYHIGKPLMMSISDKNNTYVIKEYLFNDVLDFIKNKNITTYDLKKNIISLKKEIKAQEDLMISSYLLDLPSANDISLLMSAFNKNIINFETLKKNNFENIEEVVATKSRFIYDIKEDLLDKIKKDNLENILYDIEMPLVYVLAEMEKTGVKFEINNLKDLKVEVLNKLDKIKDEIYNMAGSEFNILSHKQLGIVLYDELNIINKPRNGKYKTDSKTLQKYEKGNPIITKIFEYRHLMKIFNTYLETLNNYVLEDGKIHTIFNQTLTRTGRLSSSEPNLQNIPTREEIGKKIRLGFIPSNDLILSADYSQIELRILAHISKSEDLINAFINEEDIHTKVAADIHGIKESEVTKEMRSMAKAVIFGIVYGISEFGLGDNLQISSFEAKDFIEKYYELYPGVKKYMDDVVKEAYQNGYVKTMFGRIRKINELTDTNYMIRKQGERMAMNTPIQGTSADIMKKAMILVFNKMKEKNLKSKLILQIHDEIIIDAKKEEVDVLKDLVKDTMENIVKLSVPLKVEVSTGINWYEAK